MNSVFLAWQAPASRRWYPVGQLSREGETYTFVYTEGAREAQAESGFRAFGSFPELGERYESNEIFPLFENRVLGIGRPEYDDFVEWLNLPPDEADPIAILARSGGHRATDTLEMFPRPERGPDDVFQVHFFVHGLRHQIPAAQERAGRLQPGERLRLLHDYQNHRDERAQALRTDEVAPGDMHLLGYVPRYLAHDVIIAPERGEDVPLVQVERVNIEAPVHFRVLCRLSMPWPEDYEPFSSPSYQPIAHSNSASEMVNFDS